MIPPTDPIIITKIAAIRIINVERLEMVKDLSEFLSTKAGRKLLNDLRDYSRWCRSNPEDMVELISEAEMSRMEFLEAVKEKEG